MNLQQGLVGHWTLDESEIDNGTVRDKSGFSNHGTLDGPEPGQPGISGTACQWNGDGDQIVIDKNGALDVEEKITICAWANLNSGEDDNGNPSHHIFSSNYGLIHANFFVQDPSTGNREGANPTVPVDGNWHHLAMTFDGTTVRAYIDGTLDDTHSYTGTIDSNDNTLKIGNAAGADWTTDGKIDDVRIYKRALSESEIKELYNQRASRQTASSGFPVAADSLVAHYPFTDGSARDDARSSHYGDPTSYDGSVSGAVYDGQAGHRGTGAYDFTGSNTDDIGFPNSAVQTGNETRTTMGWFKVESDTGDRQMAFGSADGSSGSAWEMEVYNCYNGGVNGAIGVHTWSGYNKSNDGVISLNEWFHFAATHDGDPTNIQLYLNGEPIATENSNQSSTSLSTSSANFRAGYSEAHSTGAHDFAGQAADLRIYDRDLTDAEIARIYQNTRPTVTASGGTTVTDELIAGEKYRIHAFENTGSDTFTVTDAQTNATVDALVVGGGGAGGGEFSGGTTAGGGGGGGIVHVEDLNISEQDYTVDVGDGGEPTDTDGNRGEDTVFGSYTAYGGGGGARGKKDNDAPTYNTYGAGGGASGNDDTVNGAPATDQGNAGGDGTLDGGSDGVLAGGGGGGTLSDTGGAGGDGGDYANIFGTKFGENGVFAGGGGAGQSATGGLGGGGNASNNPDAADGPGVDGTGGGGGAGEDNQQGFAGGSGIVLIRYKL